MFLYMYLRSPFVRFQGFGFLYIGARTSRDHLPTFIGPPTNCQVVLGSYNTMYDIHRHIL